MQQCLKVGLRCCREPLTSMEIHWQVHIAEWAIHGWDLIEGSRSLEHAFKYVSFFKFCPCDYNIIITFLPSISSLQALPYTLSCYSSNSWALLSLIVIAPIYVYVYKSIPKHNLYSSYNATCMYIFTADHLVRDNQ